MKRIINVKAAISLLGASLMLAASSSGAQWQKRHEGFLTLK
jgi:hypothetical protein